MKQVNLFEASEDPDKLTLKVNNYIEQLYASNFQVLDILYQTTHDETQWYSAMIIYDKDMSRE